MEHDIWNRDIPAPPILTGLKNDLDIDVVVAVTKLGNTIILDRLSGEQSLILKRKKHQFQKYLGKTAAYQPVIEIPEPFANQFFQQRILQTYQMKAENVSNRLKEMNYGFFVPGSLDKNSYLQLDGRSRMDGCKYRPKFCNYVCNSIQYPIRSIFN